MKYEKNLRIGLGIIVLNLIIGHFFAPSGIFLTPIVLIIVSLLLSFGWSMDKNEIDSIPSVHKSLYMFGMVLIQDVGTRLFAGGDHDAEGSGWIFLFLLLGLVPMVIALFTAILTNQQENNLDKIKAMLFFMSLVGGYFGLLELLMPILY
jgi:hypothetical protein